MRETSPTAGRHRHLAGMAATTLGMLVAALAALAAAPSPDVAVALVAVATFGHGAALALAGHLRAGEQVCLPRTGVCVGARPDAAETPT
jgi:hypothetical protein